MRALRTRSNREHKGRFVAEGVRVVEELVQSDLAVRWVVTSSTCEDTERGRALVDSIDELGIPRREIEERELAALSDTDAPQGIVAVAEIPAWDLTDIPEVEGRPNVVLVLDAVQDPGNFGTLLRSAEALGATGVIALTGTVDPWNPKSVRSAAGSSFRLPIVQSRWEPAQAALRERGFAVLGADAAGRPVRELKGERLALVVGNEGAGLSEAIRREADALVAVPIRGRAESLNVAAAAAILLYELTS